MAPKLEDSWMSGFCSAGLHEGTKPKSYNDTPMRTCKWSFTRDYRGTLIVCTCQCHKTLTEMYEMMGMERVLVDNPEYRPFHRSWWMPADDPDYGRRSLPGDGPVDPTTYRTPAGAPTPPVRPRDYTPTPTGRMARGQLEYRVKGICDQYAAGELEIEFCTPKAVAQALDPADPPSVGAIDAVFTRWAQLGFAVIEKKPTRFHSYTPEGWTLGLDALKDRAKRADKMKTAAQRRGERV